jgi:hypothetical protein
VTLTILALPVPANDDALCAARGAALGVLLVVPFWVGVVVLGWWLCP